MLTFINEPIDLSEFLRLGLPEISANVLFDPIHTYVVGDPVISSVSIWFSSFLLRRTNTLVLSINDEQGNLSGFLGAVAEARKLHLLDKIRFIRREKLRLRAYTECYRHQYVYLESRGVAVHKNYQPIQLEPRPSGQYFWRTKTGWAPIP